MLDYTVIKRIHMSEETSDVILLHIWSLLASQGVSVGA